MEKYGLTKEDYRRLIENGTVKAVDISKKITIPQKIFRFRRLGYVDENKKWVESNHWRDDVNGICKFSIPSAFNKNDNDDCKVRFNNEEIINYMFRNCNRERRRMLKKKKEELIEKYKTSLQGRMKVGCFTIAGPLTNEMWDDPNFGDEGRGICFKYKVDDSNFRPDGLSFLPVLYDDVPYDNTEAVKGVIDYAEDNSNGMAASKMVCLGYGHTLIKPTKYEKEQEWRLVIPNRDDGVHLDYFNVDQETKRNMTSCVRAVYIGPNFWKLLNANQYMCEINNKWGTNGIPIYQVINENGRLRIEKVNKGIKRNNEKNIR